MHVDRLICVNVPAIVLVSSSQFGGKLISFTKQQQPNAGAPAAQLVHISQVVTEQKLMAQSAQLESALSTGNFSDFCQLKVQASSDTNRQLAWSFLQVGRFSSLSIS